MELGQLKLAMGCWLVAQTWVALWAAEPQYAAPPGYRGLDTSGVYPARGLLERWPAEGPRLLWKAPLGNSAAPVTVWKDRVYAVAGRDAWLHVFDLDGKQQGKAHLGSASWKRFGFSRSTPLVAEGLAVGTTPNGNLYGIDLETMSTRWTVNAWKDFGSGKGYQGWGLPESPILHGVNVVFNPVSRDDETPPLVAVDIRDARQVVWQMDPGVGKFYSAGDNSAASFRHKGRDLIASASYCYIACVEADTGKTLWEIPSAGPKWMTPVYSDGMLLLTVHREQAEDGDRKFTRWPSLPLDPDYRPSGAATQPAPVTFRKRMNQTGWGGGELAMLRLSDDGADASVLWVRPDAPDRFSHAVVVGGRVYCFGNPRAVADKSTDGGFPPPPESVSRGRSSLLCLDAATGKLLAHVPAETHGHIVAADGRIYAVDLVKVANPADPTARPKQSPRLRLLSPTPKGFEVTGEFVVFGYRDVPELRDGEWEASVPPVIASGRIFFKYGPLMAFDVRGPGYQPLPAPPAAPAPPLEPSVPFPTTGMATVPPDAGPALIKQLASRLDRHRAGAVHLLCRPELLGREELAVQLGAAVASEAPHAWPSQRAAAAVLTAWGPKARAAVPSLQKAIPAAVARRDGNSARLALATMHAIDEAAMAPLAAPLSELLRNSDPYVQYLAASLLKRMGPHAREAATPLAQALAAGQARVSYEACEALCAAGAAARHAAPALRNALVSAIEAGHEARCALAARALRTVDPAGMGPVVTKLAAILRQGDIDRGKLAARVLAKAGPAGAQAIPELVATLKSSDQDLRDLASAALSELRSEASTAVGELAKIIESGEGPTRLAAVASVAQMGKGGAAAVGALLKAMADPDVTVARAAAKALGAIGPGAKEAVGPLAEALKHKDIELARAAATALGAIGPDAQPAAAPLLAAMKHNDGVMRDCAVRALTQIGRPPMDALLAMLGSDGPLQPWAAGALARFSEHADTVVPALAEALTSKDQRLVAAAAGSLRSMGPRSAKALPALMRLASSPEPRAAAQALSAVSQMGAEAKVAVPALIEMAKSGDPQRAMPAIAALAGIGPAAEAAVGPLVQLSRTADRALSESIARTLASIKAKNSPPTAANATATCLEGGSVIVELPATDDDDVASLLNVRIDQPPANGTVERPAEWTARLAMVYRSRPGFVGNDTFIWRVSDSKREEGQSARATITVTPDTTPPKIASAGVPLGADQAVVVMFDEPVAPDSAQQAGNYALDRGARILEARLEEAGRAVTLRTTPLSAGAYQLTATGIKDRAKAANPGGGRASFDHRPLARGLSYAYWAKSPQVDWTSRNVPTVGSPTTRPSSTGVSEKIAPIADVARGSLLKLEGVLAIPKVGADYAACTFDLVATGQAVLYIDGVQVVRSDGRGRPQPREVTLAAGLHPMTVLFSHSAATAPSLVLKWSAPSMAEEEVPAAALSHPAGP